MKSPTINSASPYLQRFALAGSLAAVSLSMAVGLLASSAWLISMAAMQPPILALQVAVVGVRFFGLGRGVFRYSERLVSHDAILRAATSLQLLLYKALAQRPPFSSNVVGQGKLLQQLSADIESVQDRWIRLVIPFCGALLSGWAGIGIVTWLVPQIGFAMLLLFILAITLIPLIAGKHSLSHSGQIFESETRIADQVSNACRSHLEAEVYGYQEQLQVALEAEELAIINQEKRLVRNSGIGGSLHLLLMYSALITAFLMGLEALREGELAGVNLAVITLLPLAIFDGIPALIAPLSSMGKIDRATKAIDNLAVYPQGERGSMPIKADEVLIELCEARAKWGASSLQHMPISTEFVGSVPTLVQGESGIGKTSLAYALSGLIDYEGSITVNGVELRKLDLVGLRRISTILLQEEHLFASSLRENLRIAKPGATDDELFETLVKVEMDVTVRNLPYGLDTIVGAFGTNFSSGEKQRFRLARVFLRDSQFYLLDEPFEHLTLEQAERIMGRILSHCFGRTLVIISHQAHSWAHNRVVLKTH